MIFTKSTWNINFCLTCKVSILFWVQLDVIYHWSRAYSEWTSFPKVWVPNFTLLFWNLCVSVSTKSYSQVIWHNMSTHYKSFTLSCWCPVPVFIKTWNICPSFYSTREHFLKWSWLLAQQEAALQNCFCKELKSI